MNDSGEHMRGLNSAFGPTDPGAPAPPATGPFFDRTDWLSFLLTAGVALAVYLSTLAPEVTLEFSGIFATGAWYAGVPHPPGYPVWSLYAWLFTVALPFSNIAWRAAVSSAVAGALACGLVALMVARGGAYLLEGTRGLKQCEGKTGVWLRVAAGYAAGMVFGLDRAIWSQAVVVEAWALSHLLCSLLLCLLLRWTFASGQVRPLYEALFVYGLVLCTNQGLLIAAPGFAVLLALGDRALGRNVCLVTALLVGVAFVALRLGVLPADIEAVAQFSSLWPVYGLAGLAALTAGAVLAVKARCLFTRWKPVLAGSLLLGLGLSPYLYLPIASMTNPPMNWGYPRTVEGFGHLVSRGQYERIRPTDNLGRFAQQLWGYGETTASDFGLIYLFPCLVPFWFHRRMPPSGRRWMVGLLSLYVCLSVFLIAMLNPSGDRASQDLVRRYFSTSHLVLAVWMGYGLVLAGAFLQRPTRKIADPSVRQS